MNTLNCSLTLDFPAAAAAVGVLKEFGNRNSAIIICETLFLFIIFIPPPQRERKDNSPPRRVQKSSTTIHIHSTADRAPGQVTYYNVLTTVRTALRCVRDATQLAVRDSNEFVVQIGSPIWPTRDVAVDATVMAWLLAGITSSRMILKIIRVLSIQSGRYRQAGLPAALGSLRRWVRAHGTHT